MTDVVLKISGREYKGWTSVRISQDIKSVAWDFTATVTLPRSGSLAIDIKKQQHFKLYAHKQLVMTGIIDDVGVQYDDTDISFSVAGRSTTGQLVDSAAIVKGSQFNDMSLPDIARAICKPFHIDVVTPNAVAKQGFLDAIELQYTLFHTIRIEQGETCYELLARLARQEGFLLTTDRTGNLMITRANFELATPNIELGVNVLTGDSTTSIKSRASEYIVKGSSVGGGFPAPDQSAGNAVKVKDNEIVLYRPQIVICETSMTDALAKQRGQWKRCTDLGSGDSATHTLTGWKNNNQIWTPNYLVNVIDPLMNLNAKRIITSVTLTNDENGEIASIVTQPPESLVVMKTQKSNEESL